MYLSADASGLGKISRYSLSIHQCTGSEFTEVADILFFATFAIFCELLTRFRKMIVCGRGMPY
jgi:hypothetical protein